ncbi:helix-turn-helix transcriptional regulator [Capnocytophaga cynodegmi]|uniref:helix-turn-helix transcriptional regulator n=1 Tax=Capnocytophaga cynodegmi TaxID=28189 RepID=UPI0037D48C68
MTNFSTQKERILQFIEYKGISKNKFYIETGISNGVLDKKSGLSMDTVEKFYSTYPEINPEWLLTGRGNMLKSDNENKESSIIIHHGDRKTRDKIIESQEIPLYDLEATAGLVDLFKGGKAAKVLETIKIPNLPSCDGALSVTGDSMYPLLKSGDIVLYKQIPVNPDSIFFGEMYLLGVMIDEFEEMITVKYVQKSDKGDDYVKLVSLNQHHQSKDIQIKRVTAMAIIKASIRFNTMF